MKIRNTGRREEDTGLQMTAMIDIVFLLLVFFVMTFKIVAPEGDFNIKMPAQAAQGTPDPSAVPPIKIRITATDSGRIGTIKFAEVPLGGLKELREKVLSFIGDAQGPSGLEGAEIEFDCDYNLRYEYVIQAMTAVSGYVQDGQVVKLVEKIKFTPPRKP